MSYVYAEDDGARPIGAGFVALAVLAPVVVFALIAAGLLYYSGSSARVASLYAATAALASH